MGEQNDEASRLPAGATPDGTGVGATAVSDETAELLSLIDRLGALLERSDLAELEVVGYGATADASHITLPAPGGAGAVRAIRRALEKASLTVDDLDMVNAHATSTPEGDPRELEAIRTIFGERAGQVSITANKSMIGHTLGAAGAIETIATVMSLRTGIVPPTINLDDPDEAAAGLDLTPNVARHRSMDVAVSDSFGFGGQNSALVIRRRTE